ncbi:histidine kinase [Sphingobacterium sp. 1.A.5]|jgi:hypothetical protein|uniref:histidine kinase n=1 Tax=Sphingobacterium sp. 1.A.5 TaxID=2044604 RepID=UPI000C0BFF48|nr:histidine kinase [Sphingobacterium sp. 1.A.5]
MTESYLSSIKRTMAGRTVRHAGFWLAYATYFYVVNRLGNQNLTFPTVIFSLPFFLLVYYGVGHALGTHFSRGRYAAAAGLVLAVYLAAFLGMLSLTHGVASHLGLFSEYFTSSPQFSMGKFLQNYLKLIGNFSIFAALGHQYRTKLASMEKEGRERESRLRFEYAALAQQVSPHLLANLFQSLDRQMSGGVPEQVRSGVMDLYGLMLHYMRASLPEGSRTVLLSEELGACRRFIQVNSSMSGREPTFRWELSGELSGAVVPPTTLLTLVENVFKHGDPYCPCLPPQIRVSVGRDLCTISVSNTCSKGKPTPDGHGLGLANLRKRLHHVFQNRYQMVCSCHKGVHSVDITIEF